MNLNKELIGTKSGLLSKVYHKLSILAQVKPDSEVIRDTYKAIHSLKVTEDLLEVDEVLSNELIGYYY